MDDRSRPEAHPFTNCYDPPCNRVPLFQFYPMFISGKKKVVDIGPKDPGEDRSDLRDTSVHDKRDSCLCYYVPSRSYTHVFSLYHIVVIVSLYV